MVRRIDNIGGGSGGPFLLRRVRREGGRGMVGPDHSSMAPGGSRTPLLRTVVRAIAKSRSRSSVVPDAAPAGILGPFGILQNIGSIQHLCMHIFP